MEALARRKDEREDGGMPGLEALARWAVTCWGGGLVRVILQAYRICEGSGWGRVEIWVQVGFEIMDLTRHAPLQGWISRESRVFVGQ